MKKSTIKLAAKIAATFGEIVIAKDILFAMRKNHSILVYIPMALTTVIGEIVLFDKVIEKINSGVDKFFDDVKNTTVLKEEHDG